MANPAQASLESLGVALVAAFPDYLEQRLAEFGVDVDASLQEVIDAACVELGMALRTLAMIPPAEQQRSPLELVRAATLPITAHLLQSGVPAPVRDEHSRQLHPEDVYHLYPASSRDLGEDAWLLHIQWGAEKARQVAGMVRVPARRSPNPAQPAVGLFGIEVDLRDSVTVRVAELDYQALVWRNPAALTAGLDSHPQLVLVDLRHPAANDAIRTVAGAGIRVVGVGHDVDDFATAATMALGAEEVIALDRVVDRLGGLLPRIV